MHLMRLLQLLLVSILMLTSACSSLSSLSSLPQLSIGGSDDAEQLVKDNRSVKTALQAAMAAVDVGDNASAAQHFEQMMEQGAQSPASLNHYAIFLREQWRIDEAEQVYQQALKHSPADAMTHWNLAILYELYKGDNQQALAHFSRYKELAAEPDKRVNIWITDLSRRVEQ